MTKPSPTTCCEKCSKSQNYGLCDNVACSCHTVKAHQPQPIMETGRCSECKMLSWERHMSDCSHLQPSAGWEERFDIAWRDGKFDGDINDLRVLGVFKAFIASEIARAKEEERQACAIAAQNFNTQGLSVNDALIKAAQLIRSRTTK